MAASSSASTALASLPRRAPTPPRDNHDDDDDDDHDENNDHHSNMNECSDDNMDAAAAADALRFLEHGHHDALAPPSAIAMARTLSKTKQTRGTSDTSPLPLLKPATETATPTRTPTAKSTTVDAAGTDIVVTTTAKKVGFSPWPMYHKIPALGQSSSPAPAFSAQPVVSSPISHNPAPRPLKSILKPPHEPLPRQDDDPAAHDYSFSADDPEGFRRMLQSALTQLEGPSRDGRRDAYMALNGSIRAYASVPDPQLLAERMARLTQCLSRDLAWKDATGRLDTAIVQQALSLTCAILFDAQTSGLLDHEFQAFVLDRSIFVLEQADMSKAIVKGHLHLLCVQRFPRIAFSAGRAERLITVMQNLEARNSMVAARLVIYQRLIERAPNAMLTRIKDWIEHVFHALLSSMTDIQRRAIDCCAQLGMLLGHHPQTAKAISELCDKEIEEGQGYGDYLNMHLIQMTSDKERAPLVPEIWVAVVLCFRNKRYPIGKWPKFRNWLLTIQKCLNSSDMAVKRPANIAWNRLVFAVMPDSSVSEPLRSMLKVPILAGLERRGNSELSQQLRQLSLESYCNLLHYAMRPDLTHDELDLAWEMYVDPVLFKVSKISGKGRNTAFQILHGLLKKSGGTWNIDAANEHEPIQPGDLPRLDVRWVRSRMTRFLDILEPMIVHETVHSAEMQRAIDNCWRSLMAAIAEAGCQEVKASNELKESIALTLGFFRRLWTSASRLTSEDDPTVWIHRYQSMLEVTVEQLGFAHFVDDILTESATGAVEAAPASTHRLSKPSAALCSPFMMLFRQYYEPPSALQAPSIIQTSAAWFLRLLAGAKASTSGLLGLLQRSLQAVPAGPSNGLERVYGVLWSAVADTATAALKVQVTTSPKRDTFVMGVALKSTVSIVLEGLRYSDDECQRRLVSLYNAACQSARHVAGNGGIVLAVMEPLAKLINEHVSELALTAALQIAATMAESSVWPSTRSELDQSRKALWTVSLEPCKMQVFDPFDHVYKFFGHVLGWAYGGVEGLSNSQTALLSMFTSSLTSFLRRCPSTLFTTAFRKLQRGHATWAEDSRRLVVPQLDTSDSNNGSKNSTSNLQHDIEQLWSQLLQLVVEKVPSTNSDLLEVIEIFLIAGLSSPSRSIVNSTIEFWNTTFGKQAKLDYPIKLFPVLRARQIEAELLLPGFSAPSDATQHVSFPAFAQSQLSTIVDRRPSISGNRTRIRPREPNCENIFIRQHLAAQAQASGLDAAPTKSNSAASTTADVQRPRVDDSQAQFAPILCDEVESRPSTQVLTEHQREVSDRQQINSKAYPGLSSSPETHESIARRTIGKNLKFVSDLRRTPNGEIVVVSRNCRDDAPFSDDIPSSPTPRSSCVVDKPATLTTYHQEEHCTASDPPSSPPRQSKANAVIVDSPAAGRAKDTTSTGSEAPPPFRAINMPGTGAHEPMMAESDLPSDTPLPDAQLRHEEELASKLALERDSHEISLTPGQPGTPSRINETDLIASQHTTTSTPDSLNSVRSVRSSKKRKRSAEIVHSAKKRKPQSPFKKFMSIFHTAQNDDIEEEIVVARRASLSPVSSLPAASIQETSQNQEAQSQVSDASSNSFEIQAPEAVPTVKRRRGRPKKSVISVASPILTRGLKRSALCIEPYDNASPSVTKAPRLTTPGHDVPGIDTLEHHDGSQQSPTFQTVPESVYSTATTGADDKDVVDEETEDHTTMHESDVSDEQQPLAASRRIAQPQSILGRLRGILADCKSMILGSQEEEREFDDVLFEIRREVHGAAAQRRAG
ncbi:putative telomere-associated protein Rif1 [Septoria linicola]|nr:putative telomere-associated protein Rif1 [Septoria linicola]